LAAFENPVAIAEGADGAPRLFNAASWHRSQQSELPVLTVSASNALSLGDLNYSGGFLNVSTVSASFVTAGIIEIVAVTGSARFNATEDATAGAGEIQILKNGVQVTVFSQPSGSAVKTFDIDIEVGDTIEWRVRTTSGTTHTIRDIAVLASDGYIRQGIPAIWTETL
jgi:hypothetical protein